MKRAGHDITAEMLTLAKFKGWNASQAGIHFGFHAQSMRDAARRLGVILPVGKTGRASGRDKLRDVQSASDARVKAWSCAPSAIARAILCHEASK